MEPHGDEICILFFRSLNGSFRSIRSRRVYLHRASAGTANGSQTVNTYEGRCDPSQVSGLGFIRLGLVCVDLLIGLEAYFYRVARGKVAQLTDKKFRRRSHVITEAPWAAGMPGDKPYFITRI